MADSLLAGIPTHVIAGPLGAGKTSLIRHLLAQRPASERWAILINEFGQVGIDAALLESGEDGVTIAEVAGGCLCCVNGVPFQVGLTRLLRRARPDRLLIEASGLGHPAPLMQQLARSPWDSVLRVHPLTLVLDASGLSAGIALPTSCAEALDLAGLVVMNKAEALDASARERASMQAANPRQAWCSHGQLSLGKLPGFVEPRSHQAVVRPDSAEHAQATVNLSQPRRLWLSSEQWHRSEQTADGGYSLGWIMSPAIRFDQSALDGWLGSLSWRRAKGVIRTNGGWLRFNALAGACFDWQQSPPRADNRIELISDEPLDAQALERGLRDTLHCG